MTQPTAENPLPGLTIMNRGTAEFRLVAGDWDAIALLAATVRNFALMTANGRQAWTDAHERASLIAVPVLALAPHPDVDADVATLRWAEALNYCDQYGEAVEDKFRLIASGLNASACAYVLPLTGEFPDLRARVLAHTQVKPFWEEAPGGALIKSPSDKPLIERMRMMEDK